MEFKTVAYQTNGLDVEVYDERFAHGDPLLEGDLEFYLEYARRYGRGGGGPVLELGCGTGRITWELACMGCDVVGLDLSPLMISQAKDKMFSMPSAALRHIEFLEGDMTAFDLQREFPLVIVPGRTFQCLDTVEKQKDCLKMMRGHMEDGGRLILDLFDPKFEPVSEEQLEEDENNLPIVKHPKTGNLVKIDFVERVSDMFTQTFEDTYLYSEMTYTGTVLRTEEAKLKMRWSTRQEMLHLFEMCGLEVTEEYSDFYKSAPAYGKEQVWVLKKK
tara:strand:- start:58724 stop:59545 length:822 start_codon:yes stop_codon:yes gene_type:complete